jgi:Zn-dependent M32 family carboxypeptidase
MDVAGAVSVGVGEEAVFIEGSHLRVHQASAALRWHEADSRNDWLIFVALYRNVVAARRRHVAHAN